MNGGGVFGCEAPAGHDETFLNAESAKNAKATETGILFNLLRERTQRRFNVAPEPDA